uniref:Desmoplakin n=1 Tax=Neogobius melanostomus TaxID=47308 RepID=A0A8C6S955_9GOBI
MLLSPECADYLLEAQAATGHIIDPKNNKKLTVDEAFNDNVVDSSDRERLLAAEKKRCKTDPNSGLLLLPVNKKLDVSKLIFDGVRKPVTAEQLHDCEVIDKPILKALQTEKKSAPEVSNDKKVNLKGTGPIAGIIVEKKGKMSLSEAKKEMLVTPECADLLLEAQAATGHIIDPQNNKKLTVDEACSKEVVDINDRERLLEAEKAAVGYKDPYSGKPLSVFEAMKKGLLDKEDGLRLLQAQESVGGILDPKLSVFLPKETAIKRNILDENTKRSLDQSPKCYIDPETEDSVTYNDLKKRCKADPETGLLLLPVSDKPVIFDGVRKPVTAKELHECEKIDSSQLIFDGVRKPVTAKQLSDCEVIDKPTLKDLQTEKKTVKEVSAEKIVNLKGTGPIAGIVVGQNKRMSLSEAKKEMLVTPECADLLLEAQAATGHIIDPQNNKKLTVDEACAKSVVDTNDQKRLLEAEKAAVGYKDPYSTQPLSVFEAMKKGLVDKETGLRLLQAQESVGGILDPKLSVFLPKETAIRNNILDENTKRSLDQSPKCYIDPETEDSKLTVDEACAKKVVDTNDRKRLLEAEKAAVGYKDPYSAQ